MFVYLLLCVVSLYLYFVFTYSHLTPDPTLTTPPVPSCDHDPRVAEERHGEHQGAGREGEGEAGPGQGAGHPRGHAQGRGQQVSRGCKQTDGGNCDVPRRYCVDCDSKGPRWASWNLGIFLCIRCAGIHRNLGVHISRVKSVNLDSWKPKEVAVSTDYPDIMMRW